MFGHSGMKRAHASFVTIFSNGYNYGVNVEGSGVQVFETQ